MSSLAPAGSGARANQRVEPTGMSLVASRERRWAGGSRARRLGNLAVEVEH